MGAAILEQQEQLAYKESFPTTVELGMKKVYFLEASFSEFIISPIRQLNIHFSINNLKKIGHSEKMVKLQKQNKV